MNEASTEIDFVIDQIVMIALTLLSIIFGVFDLLFPFVWTTIAILFITFGIVSIFTKFEMKVSEHYPLIFFLFLFSTVPTVVDRLLEINF